TISGIITDDVGAAVIGADVILYRVETDNSLTPIALTKTIANGVYLFVNTPQGNYKIKSSKTVVE
ncbi:MAG: carboxypeptidase-like regulatory domain-containing protein, partial [Oscillospiraceae bacterium]